MAVPLAALNFVSTTPASASAGQAQVAARLPTADYDRPYYDGSTDEASAHAAAVAPVAAAIAAAEPGWSEKLERDLEEMGERLEAKWGGKGPKPGTVGPKGHVGPRPGEIERAIALRAVGATRDYAASLRAVAPHLAKLPTEELVPLAAVGVTPAYVRELAGAGYRKLDADELMQAKALNIRGDYIRNLAGAGYRHLTIDQLSELRSMGVTAADIQRFRRAGHKRLSVDDLVELKAVGHVKVNVDVDVDHDSDHDEDRDEGHDDGS
jgi:hypothetical protein